MSGDTPRDDAAVPPREDLTPDSGEPPAPQAAPAPAEPVACDYCGSPDLAWIQCKLVCRRCHQINLSCSDL